MMTVMCGRVTPRDRCGNRRGQGAGNAPGRATPRGAGTSLGCPRARGAWALGGQMRTTRWNQQRCALAVAGLAVAALAAPGLPAASAAGAPGPALRLIAAQRSIILNSFSGKVYLDTGIWVAALGSPLQFDVQRAGYTKPITISQIIHLRSGGTVRRPLP